MLSFLAGFAVAAAAAAALFVRARRKIAAMRDELAASAEEGEIVLDFMHKIVTDVGSGADKSALYSRILRTVTLGCGATSACIYERNERGAMKAVACEGAFPPQREISPSEILSAPSRAALIGRVLKGEELEPREGVIGEAASSGKPVFIKNAESSARVVNHKDASLKITSLMALPMSFRNEFYGVLAIANPIGGGAFSDSDFSVARSIADQAALSLYNISAFSQLVEKSKLDSDLSLASSVQSYLLPETLPGAEGCELAAKYIPQQKVGGDFYDSFSLPGGKVGAVIGDVSGKGISAAILMALCQTKLRYIARESASPSQALKALNREMLPSMRSDMFITLVYAVIDPASGTISIARAGHEKPIVYSASRGSADFVKSRGAAVGMVSSEIFDAKIEDVEIPFERGDMLVLYTDGVTEATNPEGEEFTTGRLCGIVSRLGSSPAGDLNEAIIAEVLAFAQKGRPDEDDFTLLSVRRLP